MEKFCKKGYLKRSGKRVLSILLCACMIGTMIPITARAETEGTSMPSNGEVTCTCANLCTEDKVNSDCPVCGAEEADLSKCTGKAQSENNENQLNTGESEEAKNETELTITGWEWIDEEELINPETGILALPFANEETPAFFDDVVALLPTQIQATVVNEEDIEAKAASETITLGDWSCEEYPKEGAYSESYTFAAALPEGYVLSEEAKALNVSVELGGAQMYESVEAGAFTVTGGTLGTDYTYENNVLTIISETPITIANTDPSTPTTDRIEVAENVSANITLAGVNIDVSSKSDTAAFKIADNSSRDVTITLADDSVNTLKSGNNCAGLQKNGAEENIGKLTIQGGTNGTGKLIAESSGLNGGAGIGGGNSNSGSNIEIRSGTVTAKSNGQGAGIGGSGYGSGSNITISGGTVTATGSWAGAGIGGGYKGAGSNITISGGTVTATGGGYNGAGIGGGYFGDGYDITISGGSVKAVAGKDANNIGGGAGGNNAVTPTSDDKTPVYLLTIANPDSKEVLIDGKSYKPVNHKAVDENDTNLYAYLPAKTVTEPNVVQVGTETTKYVYENSEWHIVVPEEYDENGFCTSYELTNGKWALKNGATTCAIHGDTCKGYQPAVEEQLDYDINGDGTIDVNDKAYKITNAGQLYWFADKINNDYENYKDKNAVLTKDITVNEGVLSNGVLNKANEGTFRSWTPIAPSISNPYKAIFDGQRKTISGLYFSSEQNSESGLCVGLFGAIEDGKIKNVGVVDSYIRCDGAKSYVGGVCGYSRSTIEDCYNTGKVTGGDDSLVGGVCGYSISAIEDCYNTGEVTGGDKSYVGGVSGHITSKTIEKCYNTGKVTGGDKSYVGGVSGLGSSGSKFSDSYNKGEVTGGENSSVGGVSGYGAYTTIEKCHNTGKVTGGGGENSSVGGVCGFGGGSKFSDSYNKGEVTGGDNSSVGGVSGNSSGTTIENSNNTGAVNGGDNSSVGGVCGYSSGTTIKKNYNTGEVTGGDNSSVGGVCGYNNYPIEDCYNTGAVNGGVESSVGGVCGNIYSRSISISNSHNTGKVTSGAKSYVGGVCGRQSKGSCSIKDCYNTGKVTSGDNSYVGGVSGNDDGATYVNYCYNTGEVTGGDNSYVGGVSGNIRCGSISNSHNTGEVTGGANSKVGGVCGQNEVSIDYSYNIGKVTGGANSKVGGVCGYNINYLIEVCYNTGAVNGGVESSVGGVCGDNNNRQIENCYYDNDVYKGSAVGCNYDGTSENVEGKSTDAFKSGQVAYLLNYNGRLIWYQNLGEGGDASPVLDRTHKVVYQCSPCTGVYSNEQNVVAEHKFDADNRCSICNNVTTLDAAKEALKTDILNRKGNIKFILTGDALNGITKENMVDKGKALYTEALKHISAGESGSNAKLGDYIAKAVESYSLQASYTMVESNITGVTYSYQVTYYTDKAQEDTVDSKLSEIYNSLQLSDNTLSDAQKVFKIYDWITNNVTYDYENLNVDANKTKFTAYGALEDKKAVCQGFAGLFYRMCMDNGIDCRIVTGTATNGQSEGPHAWNIVKVGEAYYYVDATWDCKVLEDVENSRRPKPGTLYYFLRSSLDNHVESAEENVTDSYTIAAKSLTAIQIEVPEDVTEDNISSPVVLKDLCGKALSEEQLAWYNVNVTNDTTDSCKRSVTVIPSAVGLDSIVLAEETVYIHVTDDNGECTVCNKKIKNIVAAYLYDENGGEVAGEMSGLGLYAPDKEVVLVAPIVAGCNFVGWYEYSQSSENKYTGENLCKSRTYKFKTEADRNLVAVYKSIGSAELTIEGGKDFTINGDNKTTEVTTDLPIGSQITVVCNDSDFEYWKNSAGMVLSRDNSYTFTVTGKETVSAVFNKKAENKATVVFESYYGQVIARDQYAAGATLAETPGLPFRYGYTALGWDYNGDGTYDTSEGTEDTFAKALERGFASENKLVTILPVYQLNDITCQITVENGTGTRTYKQNEVVTVVANAAAEGYKFSHWAEGNGNILSYNEKYQFYATKDITVKAVYVKDTVKVEAKGTTEIVDKFADKANGKLTFVSMSTVPERCTIEKAGMILTDDSSVANSEDGFNASTAKYALGNAWSGNAYRYTVNKKNVSAGETWYVRAYLVYTDAEGNVNTVYGKMESLTMPK